MITISSADIRNITINTYRNMENIIAVITIRAIMN